MLLCFCTTSIWTEYLFWEGGRGKNKGKTVDRRQKVEEGEASKSRRSCGSWRKMRKKVSRHQTHQLPLLQRVPAQKLDETRHLTLNPGPTALLAQSERVYMWFESLSSVWCLERNSEIKTATIFCIAWFLATGPNVCGSLSLTCDTVAAKSGKNMDFKIFYVYLLDERANISQSLSSQALWASVRIHGKLYELPHLI